MNGNECLPVIVVGGGAAGLVAAGMAAQGGKRVLLLERNARPARKVMITGKGRCNLTNDCNIETLVSNVPRNGRFLYGAFSRFMPRDIMALVEEQGVPLKVERGNRVFPVSDKAVDVVDALTRFARSNGVSILQARVTELICEDGCCRGVRCEDGRVFSGESVIVCTGGVSYPQTGSTGDGYTLAMQAGHTCVPATPSLVALETVEMWCGEAQGLSLRNCALTVTEGGKVVYEDFGEMLFTHFGVSGPMVLSASAHLRAMTEGKYKLAIDLKPALTPEKLDERILRDREENNNRDLQNALTLLLPRSLVSPILRLAHIPISRKYRDLTREERKRLVETVKAVPLTVKGFRPIAEAIVTSGGVSVKEVDARTMQSKLCENLYFAGEVLDVDAYTGGFNLQIAFSTAAAAGRAVASRG